MLTSLCVTMVDVFHCPGSVILMMIVVMEVMKSRNMLVVSIVLKPSNQNALDKI